MRDHLSDARAWPLLAALVLGATLIYLLRPILAPFLVGALLAYLADPLADRLEALGLGRTLAVVAVFLALSLLFAGAILLLLPLMGRQIDLLQSLLPQAVDWMQNTGLPWLRREAGLEIPSIDLQSLRGVLAGHWQSTGNVAAAVLSRFTDSSLALAALLGNLALIPVVTFYLLRDWDRLVERIRELLPRGLEPTVSRLAAECDDVVAAFLRGQLLVMLSLAVLYTTGLWLVGLNLALLIGTLAGLVNIVPYLGFIVGIGAAGIMAVVQFGPLSPELLLVVGVFLLGQALEGMVLTPWLVGDRIGLHPVAVIFAVLAGGQMFGFVGVLLALPAAAVVLVLLRHAHRRYLESSVYKGPGAPDGAAPGADQAANPHRGE